jgi:hypothetical protein
MTNVRTVSDVTETYPHLQGFRFVPLGIPFIVSALWRIGGFEQPAGIPGRPADWFVLGLAVAIVVSFPIRSWYERTFGVAQPTVRGSGAIPLMTTLVCFFVLGWAQERFDWAIPVPALFLGLAVLYVGVRHHRLRQHYVVIAGAWFLFVAVGTTFFSPHARHVLVDLLVGGGLIVGGVGDHLVLRRTLHPPTSEDYARTV